MKKKYPVLLTDEERDHLRQLIAAGTAPARKVTHARILRKADQSPDGPGWGLSRGLDTAGEVGKPLLGCPLL
jgi:hypothetical protein